MKRAFQSLKIVAIAVLLYAFQPIAPIQAHGLVFVGDPSSARPLPSRLALAKKGTVLSIDPLKPFAIGEIPAVTVHLSTDSGEPIPNHLVRIFVYKNRKTAGLTNSTGTAHIPLRFNFYPGTYPLSAAFNGSKSEGLGISTAAAKVVMVPAQVAIRTVPRLAGIQFSFNNQILVSDANGEVHFSVDHVGTYQLEVLPVPQQPNSNVRISFYRWNDEIFSSVRDFKIPRHHVLEAGFLLSNPVNLHYSDPTNQTVDAARISKVSMYTSGINYSLDDPTRAWLPANRIEHRVGSFLESIPATYYIQNVTISGSNVVNEGQQRFQVHPNDTWPIKLFMFSANLSARDGLFKFPIGSHILLEYPDGTKKELALDSSEAMIKIDSLPRGNYYATVMGVGGIQPRMPLALSRDQDFVALALTPLDLGVLGGTPALIALILLLIGRGRDLFASFRVRKPATLEPSN